MILQPFDSETGGPAYIRSDNVPKFVAVAFS
jgi:hypothetical protein